MDDHPPSWQGNGSRFLEQFGLTSRNTWRLNLFLPNAASPYPTAIDGKEVSKGLVENFSLRELELHRCALAETAIPLAQSISVNKYLQVLGLARNKLPTPAGCELGEALKINQTLLTLDLSWNDLTDDVISSLAEALLSNNSMQRLILDRNKASCDGIGALATALSGNKRLKYLSVSQNRFGATGASLLGQAAANSRALVSLDVSMNGISEAGMFSLIHAVKKAPNLQTLNLSYNVIGDSIALVGWLLHGNCTLRELNLEQTRLNASTEANDAQSFKAFARDLGRNSSLVNLSLAANDALGDHAIQFLADELRVAKSSSMLRYLDLSDCKLTEASLVPLKEITSCLGSFHTLHLSNNKFGSAFNTGKALGGIVAASKTLRFLGVSRCGLGTSGMEGFIAALQYATCSVQELNLRGNGIEEAGFTLLLQFILHHQKLLYLDLAGNGLGKQSADRLHDVFESNPQLPYVVLDDDTVMTRRNVVEKFVEEVQHQSHPVMGETPFPPRTNGAWDLDAQTYYPSCGFSTYSLVVGSCVKRHFEGSAHAMTALFEHAGKPVKHSQVWIGNRTGGPTPNVASAKFNNQISAGSTEQLENNVGRLLISDDQMRREFNRIDVNGNGYIDHEEFKEIYRTFDSFGVSVTERQIKWLIEESGSTDGRITFDQFCVILLKLVRN